MFCEALSCLLLNSARCDKPHTPRSSALENAAAKRGGHTYCKRMGRCRVPHQDTCMRIRFKRRIILPARIGMKKIDGCASDSADYTIREYAGIVRNSSKSSASERSENSSIA